MKELCIFPLLVNWGQPDFLMVSVSAADEGSGEERHLRLSILQYNNGQMKQFRKRSESSRRSN